MTTTFELDRLLRAVLEEDGPQSVPADLVDLAMADARAVAQRRPRFTSLDGRAWPGGARPVTSAGVAGRLIRVGFVAALTAAAIGGAVLVGSLERSKPMPSEPPPSPPAIASVSALPAPFVGPGLPDALRAVWVASPEEIPALGNVNLPLRLMIGTGGTSLEVETTDFGNRTLQGRTEIVAPDTMRIVSTSDGVRCITGDESRYRWRLSADGRLLTLTAIEDACASRAATLGRTWTRSLDGDGTGGRGVLTVFEPHVQLILPPSVYRVDRSSDSLVIDDQARGWDISVVRDPWAAPDPCTEPGDNKEPVPPTIEGFVAHLASLPGMTTAVDPMSIDGRTAARVTVSSAPTGGCTGGTVWLFGPKSVTSDWWWSLEQGESTVLYLVEVGPDLFLFRWSSTDVPAGEIDTILASVSFIDALPTADPTVAP